MKLAEAIRVARESRHGFSDEQLRLLKEGGHAELADRLEYSRAAKARMGGFFGLVTGALVAFALVLTAVGTVTAVRDRVAYAESLRTLDRKLAGSRLVGFCREALEHAKVPGQAVVPARVVEICEPRVAASLAESEAERVADLTRGLAEFDALVEATR